MRRRKIEGFKNKREYICAKKWLDSRGSIFCPVSLQWSIEEIQEQTCKDMCGRFFEDPKKLRCPCTTPLVGVREVTRIGKLLVKRWEKEHPNERKKDGR